MSLSSYLIFIKTATIAKPQINFYCNEHHSKFVGYCESCCKSICKQRKHRRHRKIYYKEKCDSIDIKEIKEKSDEIKLRIIQSNQIIKFDFEDMINMKYKELKKYLTVIDQCYYDNLTTNSEMVDLVNVIINTYELCIKNDIYNRNVFYNLKQITKLNVKLLDATEENYEIRIHSLLRYYKTFFMLINFNSSVNYKISKIYSSNKRMTDLNTNTYDFWEIKVNSEKNKTEKDLFYYLKKGMKLNDDKKYVPIMNGPIKEMLCPRSSSSFLSSLTLQRNFSICSAINLPAHRLVIDGCISLMIKFLFTVVADAYIS